MVPSEHAAVALDAVSAGYASGGRGSKRGQNGAPLRLRDVSISLQPGQLCALLGPNGAGKSTLIRLIAGVVAPSRGTITLLGDAADGLSRAERARRVAVVPQTNEVALGFSVRDVVAMGRAPHQGTMMRETREDREAIARALATCELDAIADRPVAQLSGGEQKRVHIARALTQQAPIVLLDEAATHLDVHHAIALYDLIRDEVAARRLACLAAMHDLDAAARYADRVVLLKDGRVVADGPVDEVMTAELLGDTFEADIDVGRLPDGRRYVVATGSRQRNRRPDSGSRAASAEEST